MYIKLFFQKVNISTTDLKSQFLNVFALQVSWSYLWNEIDSVVAHERGIDINLKKEQGKKLLGLLSSNEAPKKTILMHSREHRDKLYEAIESQRN